MPEADKILNILSLRHPPCFAWRNFPFWHRERLAMIIKISSIPMLKHMIDVLLNRESPLKTTQFWGYRGPSLTLVRTDSHCLVEQNHFPPVQVTSHNFETVRRTHQAEVYECLCLRQLSFRLEAVNPRMLRLKTHLAGLHDTDTRETIEKAIIELVRRSTN